MIIEFPTDSTVENIFLRLQKGLVFRIGKGGQRETLQFPAMFLRGS